MARLQSLAALASAAAAAVLAGAPTLYRHAPQMLVRPLDRAGAGARGLPGRRREGRRGRVRAQQSLRRALSEQGASPDKGKPAKAPASPDGGDRQRAVLLLY